MDAIRRTLSAVNRCRRTIWKSVKKNCVPSCVRHRKRSTSTETEKDLYGVSAAVPRRIAKTQPAKKVHFNNKDFGRSDKELAVFEAEQPRNVTETDGKKKRRRARHRRNGKSQEAIKPLREEQPVREEVDGGDTNAFDPSPSSTLDQSVIIKINTDKEKIVTETVNVHLPTKKNDQLNRAEKAWVPAVVARKRAKAAGKTGVDSDDEDNTTEVVNKKVRSYLNKIAPENIDVLLKNFKALPINTVERLENVVHLIFEKAIQELNFASRYAALCWALQSLQVSCTESKQTTSFKLLVIKKCQSLFESDKARQMDSAKEIQEINSCTDPEQKKELESEHKENEKRFHDRSVANCRFIGELFNRQVIHAKIMSYCINYLICQRSDDPLECLCTLLTTAGKELDRAYDLDCTFDTLKSLTSTRSMSTRTKCMILDLLDLRANKWSAKVLDCPPKVVGEKEGNVSNTNAVKSGGINNKTPSRVGKVGDGHGIKCYNCNRSGHISRDCKEKQRCYRCDSVGHLPRDCPKSANVMSCFNCHKNGHMARYCPDKRVGIITSSSYVCSNCNKVGHFSKDCTESRDRDEKYSLLCGNCDDSWHVARDCPKVKSKIVTTVSKVVK